MYNQIKASPGGVGKAGTRKASPKLSKPNLASSIERSKTSILPASSDILDD